MMNRYTEQELTDIFFEAVSLFTECLDSDITRENTVLAFFAPDNGLEVYEGFCRKYFPKYLSENYRVDGYFQSFAAQAFVSPDRYGVMIRSDIEFRLAELQRVFLHEISHLFCCRNEISTGDFFDRYCMTGYDIQDGMMNAGYAVWREAVADIMADSMLSDYTSLTLHDVSGEIEDLYGELSLLNPDSKKCMALILVYIMLTSEVGGAAEWTSAEAELRKHLTVKDEMLYTIVKMTFENLHRSPFWEITSEFIRDLGEAYLSLLSAKALREIVT